MKRFIVLFLCVIFILSGCSSGNSTEAVSNKKTDLAGNEIITNKSGTETKVSAFPCPIEYNDSAFYLENVDFYESFSNESYSYFLYCVVTFDVSGLSDSELHWLTNEDITVAVSYNDADDGYEFVSMSEIGTLHIPDTQKLVFTLAPSNFTAYKNSFSGKDIVLLAKVKQDDKYEIKDGLEARKENMLSYVSSIPESLPDSEEIPEPIYSYMVECISQKNAFFNSLY